MTVRLAALAALLSLAACSGVSYDQAYGRPDATRWTYFEATAERVQPAIESYFLTTDWRLEQTSREDDGVVMTFGDRDGGATTIQILVERSPVEGFASRAQLYPRGRPLPRDLELYVETHD